MKIEVKTEENLFKTYLSKIITSAFESGLVEREKRFRPEIISNDLLDIINHSKSQTREEIIREIREIELAPDTNTIQTINYCENKSEAFGYGQIWIIKKIEDILNKLKK